MLISRTLYSLCCVTLFSLSVAALATESDTDTTSTRTRSADIQWEQLPNGRQIASLFGDRSDGHHISLIKFKPGMKTAPHKHSHSYTGIVIKGVARHYEPGKQATQIPLEAGSTWSVSSEVTHISECLSKTECVFAIHQDQAFDVQSAH